MNLIRPVACAAVLAVAASLTSLSPAHATSQSLFGSTVDVIAQPSGDSMVGSTAYVPVAGGTILSTLAAARGSDVVVTMLNGGSTVGTCTIYTGDTACAFSTAGLLPAGSTVVTMRFVMGATTVDFTGTIFAVTNPQPTVSIEWQDAAGIWVNGSGIAMPLRGDTALRCVVKNNSNAPVSFLGFRSEMAFLSSDPLVVPITGALAAGATGYYPVWSGPVSLASTGQCTGGVSLSDGTGTGNGTGGGVIPIAGTITVDRAPAPGRTVTITGDLIVPPVVSEYSVLLDGVPVAGSPVLVPGPDFDFTIDVDIPAPLAPGDHVLTVVASYQGQNPALAAFPFEVEGPRLAVTGAPLDGSALLGLTALVLVVAGVGGMLLAFARRRRTV